MNNNHEDLTKKILIRIAKRERQLLFIKIATSASIFIASVSGIFFAWKDLITTLSQSGFFDIASLAVSDFSSISANLPDFIFSMIESFPIFTAALLLSGVLFAIWSMAAFIDEASQLRAYRHIVSG